MKKILSCILVLTALASTGVYAQDNISVFVNGGQLTFDAAPFIENDRTLVPMRAVFEALGATVVWDEETQTVFAAQISENGNNVVSIQIGSNKAFVNSEEQTVDVPAKIVDDRTFVPLRFVSEALNSKVEWDGETQTVTITSGQ